MTDIRIRGPPEHVNLILETIKSAIPDIYYQSKPYDGDDKSGDIAIYVKVREQNQTFITRPGDDQVIEYCRTWRSKADVMHYFNIDFEAAEELLDRLNNGKMLVRIVDGKRYLFTDIRKIADCATCRYCGLDADNDPHCWYGRGQGKIDEPRICDKPDEGGVNVSAHIYKLSGMRCSDVCRQWKESDTLHFVQTCYFCSSGRNSGRCCQCMGRYPRLSLDKDGLRKIYGLESATHTRIVNF